MSATPAFGHKAFCTFGKEAVFGAFDTTGQRLRVLSWKLQQVGGFVRDETLVGTLARKAMLPAPAYWKGTFSVKMSYDLLTDLFRGAHGGYAATTVDTTARDHVFNDSLTVPFNKSFSMEYSVGDVPAGKVFRLSGVKILGFTIKGEGGIGSGGVCTVEFSIWAQQLDTNSGVGHTPAGTSEPTFAPVLFKHCVVSLDGTTDTAAAGLSRITGFEVSYMPPLDEERNYLSSGYMDEPTRTSFITPSWKLTQEFITTSAIEKYRALGTGALKLIFQNPGAAITTHTSTGVTVTGGTTLTKASGSFITDGVAVGNYVVATTTNGISQGTYVTAVVALTVTLNQGTTSPGSTQSITFTTNKELELRCGTAALVEDPQPPIESFGKLVTTHTWEGLHDTTDGASMVTRIRNGEAALT